MLFLQTVEPATLALLKRLQSSPFLSGTRLVGETALALQIGHRTSVDLDLFGSWSPQDRLQAAVETCGKAVRQGGQGRMQFYRVDGVKVDFVTYTAPWLDPPVVEDGLRLAGLRDIAAMKLFAIANRGSRKDFVDVWFLLSRFRLEEMVAWFREKFPDAALFAVFRSLVYFDDAESDFPPHMLAPFDWEKAKADIRAAVEALA